MAAAYQVELSEVAEKVYRRLYAEAQECLERGDETNSRVKQFRIVEEVLDKIIPHDPFARDRSLSGVLSGIFRVKKGRMRICYIASSESKRIVVLYISDTPRKAGDAKDPYAVFTKMVRSGKFARLLEELRIHKLPTKKKIISGLQRPKGANGGE